MKDYVKIISGVVILSLFLLNIYSEPVKVEIDLDKDLQVIEKELQKLEEKVKKQEEEEKDIDAAKEMNKVERLMREIYKQFVAIGSGKKGEEVIKKLKKIEEKLENIISHISFTIHPVVKKENDTINILEKIIKNWRFEMGNQGQGNNQQRRDEKYEMSKKQLQKLLAQLKKQREKERKRGQKNKPSQPATSAYDVPPSNPDSAEGKTPGGTGMSWGNLPEKVREALEEVEIQEIPDDIKEIYKEFKKALGKGETK